MSWFQVFLLSNVTSTRAHYGTGQMHDAGGKGRVGERLSTDFTDWKLRNGVLSFSITVASDHARGNPYVWCNDGGCDALTFWFSMNGHDKTEGVSADQCERQLYPISNNATLGDAPLADGASQHPAPPPGPDDGDYSTVDYDLPLISRAPAFEGLEVVWPSPKPSPPPLPPPLLAPPFPPPLNDYDGESYDKIRDRRAAAATKTRRRPTSRARRRVNRARRRPHARRRFPVRFRRRLPRRFPRTRRTRPRRGTRTTGG